MIIISKKNSNKIILISRKIKNEKEIKNKDPNKLKNKHINCYMKMLKICMKSENWKCIF